jgi:hypothetical protein
MYKNKKIQQLLRELFVIIKGFVHVGIPIPTDRDGYTLTVKPWYAEGGRQMQSRCKDL